MPVTAATGGTTNITAIATTVVLTLTAAHSVAAQQSKETYQTQAVRVDQGPDIDGALDDAVWGRAALIREFVQQEPEEGASATERTEVRLLYDDSNLYVGVRAFDSDPHARIKTKFYRPFFNFMFARCDHFSNLR